MTFQPGANLYTQGFGSRPEAVEVPHIDVRDPTTSDILFPIGKRWINSIGRTEWVLVAQSTSNNVTTSDWELLGGGVSLYPITPFVVGPAGQAGYQTIQSALDAAALEPDGAAVYVQAGAYSENLTIPPNVSIIGVNGPLNTQVAIVGTHTVPSTGFTTIANILFSSSGNVLTSTAAGDCTFVIDSCIFTLDGGYIINIPNWTFGQVYIINCYDGGFGGNTIANVGTGAVDLLIRSCHNLGKSGTFTYAGTGIFSMASTTTSCNLVIGGTDSRLQGCTINGSVTFSDNSSGRMTACTIVAGSASAIIAGAGTTWTVSNNVLDSQNATVIAGSGSCGFSCNVIVDDGILSGTLQQIYEPTILNGIRSSALATTTSAGSNWCGSVTLSGGTATVNTLSVNSNSLILLWRQTIGATGAAALGQLCHGTIVSGTSFVINSVQPANATALQASDVSVVGWALIN